jgi:hypothetical protein
METDLIELMRCKNCKFFDGTDCLQRERGVGVYDKTKPEESCGFFEEKENKEFTECFETIKEILKEFIETKEENYDIISLWILGTWIHESFETYPYLFINAMKGSGKTRLLKLIKELSWQGDMLASLSEAVLFRTIGTLCIDEFENVSGKDKNALRELLNTAYKRGGKVKRMKEKKMRDEDGHLCKQQVVEEFNTFRPIVIANINGMEEVLGDRCITITLEKSNNKRVTRKVENFQNHSKIQELKKRFAQSSVGVYGEKQPYTNPKEPNLGTLDVNEGFGVGWCRVLKEKNTYTFWNDYVEFRENNTTLLYTTTLPTPTYTNLHSLFKKIYDTEIDGRNLELSFPLLLIAEEVGCLDKVIEILKNIILEKKEEDIIAGKDIMLYDFVSKQLSSEEYKIIELTSTFKRFINYEPDNFRDDWLSNTWMGTALKRLNLVVKKRRMNEGVLIILNVEKAKEKMKIFK